MKRSCKFTTLFFNSMHQKHSLTYPSQFALLLGLTGLCMMIGVFIATFSGSLLLHVPISGVPLALNKIENANISRLLNTVSSFFAFLLPSYILARILSKNPFHQLGFSASFSRKQVLLLISITFVSVILSGSLGELNERIPLPANWYTKAKALEAAYKTAMISMSHMQSFGDFIFALVVIAAAPAVFEEILFRGGFQQVFIGWTNNKWAGILITSCLFSAFHFSYFGFLPRLGLGIVLGLVFEESKNIWLSILLHFLNNALVVTQLYIVARQGKSIDKTLDESMPVWWGIIAAVILYILFLSFKKESKLVIAQNSLAPAASPENVVS